MTKVVIADTSCLIALERIKHLSILKELFTEIIITEEVCSEYGKNLPEWCKVTPVTNNIRKSEILKFLDKGEASSISLSLEN